ncbi:T9SS type B sorting domain-containing protein [Spongiivirga citrea]|uniref:Gliding motility-associated C-terminal domain-containing protein n=1 Tax=Spongiivirga citrea TaxID=1481457 RepID=A0A6M0CHZ8_9FLAO|nr:gliding motility-associated C-terminal domain-containing protein [Spongiivirga citrea]NER17586.1 hypothetical protein [Spongiivirga citrea]
MKQLSTPKRIVPHYVLSRLFLLSTFLFLSNSAFAQSIKAPKPLFEYACPQPNFNSFEVAIEIEPQDFASDNVFIVELSDDQGSFQNPQILSAVENQNEELFFYSEFSFDENVYGSSYQIRVRSTSPEFVSEPSSAFEAHYISDLYLKLNNYEDVVLCSSESTTTISVDESSTSRYMWYKDGVFFMEAGAELAISEPGLYYAETYLGACTGLVYSNVVNATQDGNTASSVEVKPGLEVTLSKNESQIFTATGSDSYEWYTEDGNKLGSGDKVDISEEGKYTMVATRGNCKVTKEIFVTVIDEDLTDIALNEEEKEQLEFNENSNKIPSFISPNGDNINDKWVLPSELLNDSEVEVMIFTANGNPIFKTKNYQNDWPNNDIASKSNSTSIVYYMIRKEGQALGKGSITLVQ